MKSPTFGLVMAVMRCWTTLQEVLPETEGRQQIEQNLAREPLKAMVRQKARMWI